MTRSVSIRPPPSASLSFTFASLLICFIPLSGRSHARPVHTPTLPTKADKTVSRRVQIKNANIRLLRNGRYNHNCLSERKVVRERDIDLRPKAVWHERCEPPRRAAGQCDGRLAG